MNLPIVTEGANEASYKAAYESLLAEKRIQVVKHQQQVLQLRLKLQQQKQQLLNLQNLYHLHTVEEVESSNDIAEN